MKGYPNRARIAALVAGLLLSSCSHHRPVAVQTVPVAAPNAPRPVLPAQFAAVVPPAMDADGRYRTINSGLDPLQTEWHVRAALNVAAIGCRGAGDGALVNAYNAMLNGQKAELAAANKAVEARFRAAGGDWQAAHDSYMTRLYNFFSQPAAKADFCAAADRIAPRAAAPSGGFKAFAAASLPELEAPFIETYRQVDAYHVALARWEANKATRLAAAAPAAVTPVAAHGKPRLGYADMHVLLAWQPPQGIRVAQR
jgi:hypothetical protein